MSFHEEIARDLAEVFFNPCEFAEEHDIDGTVMLCVLAAPQVSGAYDPGLIGAIDVQLIVPDPARLAELTEGHGIEVDDCRFTIVRKAIEQGVAVFDLQRAA